MVNPLILYSLLANSSSYKLLVITLNLYPTRKPVQCCKGSTLQFILYKSFWLDIKNVRFTSRLYKIGFTNLIPIWFGCFSKKQTFEAYFPCYIYFNINLFPQTYTHHKKNKVNSRSQIVPRFNKAKKTKNQQI